MISMTSLCDEIHIILTNKREGNVHSFLKRVNKIAHPLLRRVDKIALHITHLSHLEATSPIVNWF
ncbi:hypothetical protein RHMOL_Rhmol08G0169500 [Rhododendron molle]|uniref:Uncharacterized protein n=1 Tax=Rhododendron molle TaxID=49168 RepID=A0ACC0MQH0_RHOML|nr:hypothetical protein RHMOL_Rhmol08G0169500 [Rhododendron molle]